MKKLYSALIAIAMLVIFVPTAALAAGAAGFPTWSQHLTKGRFTVLPLFGSAAVLDKETGLVWEKQPSTGVSTWFNRLTRCYNLEVGGRKGWRVPTIEELASLVDTSNASPALPTGHPFTLTSAQEDGFYWSATTFDDGVTSGAWVVDFDFGFVFVGSKSDNVFVWCVRGGQGIDGVQ